MADAVDRTRRALLTGRIGAGRDRSRLGPAPPWLAGLISPETCRACGQPCVAACPEKIIHMHPSGHADAGLAYVDFAGGPCTFCRACVEVCPEFGEPEPDDHDPGDRGSSDNGSGVRLTGDRALPPVVADAGRCLAAQGVVCVICVARCPERAIRGGAGGVVSVDQNRCTGCGACVPACPVHALGSAGTGIAPGA